MAVEIQDEEEIMSTESGEEQEAGQRPRKSGQRIRRILQRKSPRKKLRPKRRKLKHRLRKPGLKKQNRIRIKRKRKIKRPSCFRRR